MLVGGTDLPGSCPRWTANRRSVRLALTALASASCPKTRSAVPWGPQTPSRPQFLHQSAGQGRAHAFKSYSICKAFAAGSICGDLSCRTTRFPKGELPVMAEVILLSVAPAQMFRWSKGGIVKNGVQCRGWTHRSFEHGVVWLEAAWALFP